MAELLDHKLKQHKKKITNASTNTSAIAGIGKDKKPAQYWQQVVNNF